MFMLKSSKSQSVFAPILFVLIVATVIGAAGFYVFNHRKLFSGKTFSDRSRKLQIVAKPMSSINSLADGYEGCRQCDSIRLNRRRSRDTNRPLIFLPQRGPRDKYPVYAMADGELQI